MNTLSSQDVFDIVRWLTKIKELTDRLRQEPTVSISFHTLYDAANAEASLRALILERAIGPVGITDTASEDMAWVKTLLTKEPTT